MKVTVCIGSSCHLKGSRYVVDELRKLTTDNGLDDKVELAGAFCMGECQKGVCVKVDGQLHSVSPDNVKEFFDENILKAVK